MFSSSGEESSLNTNTPESSPLHERAEPPSLVQHHMDYHHTSTPSTEDSFQDATAEEEEEDFPTAPLDDDIWLEDPVPDRHLYIHEESQPYFLVFLPLSIHIGRYTSTILSDEGPQ